MTAIFQVAALQAKGFRACFLGMASDNASREVHCSNMPCMSLTCLGAQGLLLYPLHISCQLAQRCECICIAASSAPAQLCTFHGFCIMLQGVAAGQFQYVYITPEFAASRSTEEIAAMHTACRFCLIALDEVLHCCQAMHVRAWVACTMP
jgi:superfamily II DNA helicase RecQ